MHAGRHDDGPARGPDGAVATRPGTRRPRLRLRALLVVCAVTAFLTSAVAAPAAPARPAPSVSTARTGGVTSHPQAAVRPVQTVVLAQAHGLLLTGRLGALRGGAAPTLASLDETQTAGLGALPARNVFLRGADCAWGGRTSRFASPVTLTFTLPKALFRASTLPVYRFDGRTWRRLTTRAVVGEVNTTASATITRSGTLRTAAHHRTGRSSRRTATTLVEYTGDTPQTVLADPSRERPRAPPTTPR